MSHEFSFSLLENGLDFLLSALTHLSSATEKDATDPQQRDDQKHDLKYSLLHVWSSIELILKERLRQEHWTLVFKDVNLAKLASYESGDFQSVTFKETKDRLRGICQITFTDKDTTELKSLQERRNRVEHFGTVDSVEAVVSSVSIAACFALDFIEDHFTQEVLDQEDKLMSDIQSVLLTCKAVLDQKMKNIKPELDKAGVVVTCSRCRQNTMTIDGGIVKCLFCRYEPSSPEEAAVEYITEVMGVDCGYGDPREPSTAPLFQCPECGRCALVTPARGESGRSQCFYCGEQWKSGELAECDECCEQYIVGKHDIGICSNCWERKMARAD